MATHSSILIGIIHGQRSLAGYSPRGLKESDTTEPLSRDTVCIKLLVKRMKEWLGTKFIMATKEMQT